MYFRVIKTRCKFCSGTAETVSARHFNKERYFGIDCKNCGAQKKLPPIEEVRKLMETDEITRNNP